MKQRFKNSAGYIRKKRYEAGITQAEASKLINVKAKCGQYISLIEKGGQMPLKRVPVLLEAIGGNRHDFIEEYLKDIRAEVESVLYS